MRPWRGGIAGGFIGLALFGCEEPSELVSTSPPGAYTPRKDPLPDDPAQAIGEAAPTAAAVAAAAPSKVTLYKPAKPTKKGETATTEGGVEYETIREGSGPELESGKKGIVKYKGQLKDGTVFDATPSGGTRSFVFGSHQVIEGWDEGVPGMKVGEIRKLTIPPHKGYGKLGKPPIPGNATLIFEVELVGIE
jgi:FKBP-type peptidyl-prolyl cis-trans isomerase